MSKFLTDEQVIDELRQRATELTPHAGIYGGTRPLANEIGYSTTHVSQVLSNKKPISAGFADAAGYERVVMYRRRGEP